MYTLGIPDNQYRRANQVLGPDNANHIEYNSINQNDGFYLFTFDIDYNGFQDIVILLKNNGVTTIGADTQLTERKIMKLTEYLNLNEQEAPNRMESADDIIAALEKILEEWETKEYKSDQDRWNQYYLDIEELVEDYKENQSIDRPDTSLQEQKLKKLIQILIKEWHEQN